MTDRGERILERRAVSGDEEAVDHLWRLRARAGQVGRPELLPVSLGRGMVEVECWMIVARVGAAVLLEPIPCVERHPGEGRDGRGARYVYALPETTPLARSGLTVTGMILYRPDGVPVAWKDSSPILLCGTLALRLDYRVSLGEVV